MYIGFFDRDLMHGYGKLIDSKGDLKEGLFEYNDYMHHRKEEIKEYNPNVDKIATQIDFNKYLAPYKICKEKLIYEDT